ncbi:MAG: right-handed parallel beta-helix repeat-containing protein [Planctomycetota bacterium]
MMRLVFCLLGIFLQTLATSTAYPQTTQEGAQADSEARPRIGDPGWVFDERRDDPRFPEMREWAKAGVEGGIPLRNTLPIRLRISEGDDLQSAIDRVAEQGGGVLVLGPGDYWIDRTIQLKSGVVLRGTHKDSSIIKNRMKAPFKKISGGNSVTAIEVTGQERVGFEDLTIRYATVDFEPMDKSDFYAPWENNPFHGDEVRDDQLFVHSLIFADCRNCWVDHCNLLWAGAHPLGMANCKHMTMRDNFVDRAYIKKGGMHGGYYGVWGTSYSLFYNEKVRRIRHFALMSPGCKYNVVYQCDLEVDVNYHDADDGQNLVEKSRVATPVWHSWDAISCGAQGKHRPPGPRNFLFDNKVISKGVEGYSRRGPVSEPGKIYTVMTEFGQPVVSVLENEPPPKGDTLYAVKRESR